LGLLEGRWWRGLQLVAGWLGVLECCLWWWWWWWWLLLLVVGLLGLEEAGLLWLLLLLLLLEARGLRLQWRREDGVDAACEGALLLVEAGEACG